MRVLIEFLSIAEVNMEIYKENKIYAKTKASELILIESLR